MLLKWLSNISSWQLAFYALLYVISRVLPFAVPTVYHNCSWYNPRKISHVIIKIEINNKIAIPCGQGGNPILQGSALKCNFFICFSVIEIFFTYFLFSLFFNVIAVSYTECWWVKEKCDFDLISRFLRYNLVAGKKAHWCAGGKKCFHLTSWSGKEVASSFVDHDQRVASNSRHFFFFFAQHKRKR